jgi:undecaprenyl-diphosphatase
MGPRRYSASDATPIAGAARMPYRTFLPYNAAGGVLWASAFVVVGYLAGNSYQHVAKVAGRADCCSPSCSSSPARSRSQRDGLPATPDRAAKPLLRLWHAPPVQRVAVRCGRQVAFLTDRLRPGAAFGLLLTTQLALLAILGAAFGRCSRTSSGEKS